MLATFTRVTPNLGRKTCKMDALTLAKELRKEQTNAEKSLWKILRNRQLGNLKFYRQKVLGYYIADFYCPELKLVIEVDGDVHALPEQIMHDTRRTHWLESEGFRVIRFTNQEVFGNISGVCEEILSYVQ